MGISKADILNADSTIQSTSGDDGKLAGVGSAVKLALAETSVIAETKAYFEDHGVVLDRLTETTDAQGKPKRTPRSRTMLLVKNIPYGTDVTLLTGLFEPHGPIRRLLLPPAGTLAVVEYENEDDAARAFKAVNYRRLGSAVVYLEKAPEGLIDEERSTAPDARQEAKVPETEADVAKQRVEAAGAPEEDAPSEAGSTLFVKNLSFGTTTERLQSVFSSLPSYSFARVSTKPDPKNPTGPRLSMGFGFLGFATREAAAKAMQGLKGFKLDGHDLDFKYAMRDAGEEGRDSKADAVPGKAKSKTTKMIVKNVPFEASKKDIRDLFRYVVSLLVDTLLIPAQCVRNLEILPNTEKAQFDRPRIRLPRLYYAS
jgi:multiple RNA-binding domain-containing protein 1